MILCEMAIKLTASIHEPQLQPVYAMPMLIVESMCQVAGEYDNPRRGYDGDLLPVRDR